MYYGHVLWVQSACIKGQYHDGDLDQLFAIQRSLNLQSGADPTFELQIKKHPCEFSLY